MTDLDQHRGEIRRRAIAEAWTATRLAVMDDLADTAREDGTHALRSVEDSAKRLGVGTATITRHRAELVRLGLLRERRRGGRGRGATVYDLAGSAINHRSRSTVDVIDHQVVNASVSDQSQITTERESDLGLASLSPASKPRVNGMDELAQRLATTKGWPVAHCQSQLAAKLQQLQERLNRPGSATKVLERIVATGDQGGELQPPAPAARPTLSQCPDRECPGPHQWGDGRNLYHCQGV